MKKLLLPLVFICFLQSTFAQPNELLNETFRLKFVMIGNTYYTPNGEVANFVVTQNAGINTVEAFGIQNTFSSQATFSGDTMTFENIEITLGDCSGPNCYYEDYYFYDILTTTDLDPKTFTYYLTINSDGSKDLRFRDSSLNWAFFTTSPMPEPNPLLFQTWYLYRVDVDLGDPVFINGPNPPQITVEPDFTYTGIDGCSLISGSFIFGDGDYTEFVLQPRDYLQDTSNCPPGPVGTTLYDLNYNSILNGDIYTGTDGIDYFQYETSPGFISYFRNVLVLSAPENSLNGLTVWPNPAEDKLIIGSMDNNFDAISILDVNGRTVISILDLNSKEINVSGLKSGLYFIKIASAQGSTTKKFIKN